MLADHASFSIPRIGASDTWFGVEKDLRKARNLLAVAAATGNLYAKLYLDNLLMNDDPSAKEAQRVVTSFTAFAASGVIEAAEFLSQYYSNGIGVPKDAAAGALWAQVAAGKSKAHKELKSEDGR